MATQTERRDSRQTALVSTPLCLQPPVDKAVIVPSAGDRTIWRFIREGRLEKVRLSCCVSMPRAALEKHTDASGTRVHRANPHLAPRPTAAAQSVQS
jgi:hypothetical protein